MKQQSPEEWLKGRTTAVDFDLADVEVYQRKSNRSFSGVLGDAEITACLNSGQVVIDPFEPELLNSSSYDVRLGGNYYMAEQVGHRVDFSPYSKEEVDLYYSGPHKAITHEAWCKQHGRQPFAGIDKDEYIIVLAPGECILAHTLEYIGASYGVTTMMKARSSLGRINISSCDDAGWGDVGYINRWTMEIRNKNTSVWVPLVVGMPIAQMIFFWVAASTIDYGTTGHYQSGVDIRKLQKNWSPTGMLPRMYSSGNTSLRKKMSRDKRQIF